MSEAQLERSVLESKEREELFAIAEALGTRPTSRAKKGDLVTSILRATGVEDAGDVPAPSPAPAPARRTRTRRAPAASAAVDAGEGVAGGVLEGGGATGLPLELDTPVPEGTVPPAALPTGDGGPVGGEGADAVDQGVVADDPAATANGAPEQGTISTGGAQAPDDVSPTPAGAPGNGDRFEGDGTGRRNRRRRGRDRGAERPDRELQGGGPAEVPYVGEPIAVSGLLDLRDEGYGFLRTTGFLAGAEDVYVSISQVRRFALRRGDHLEGAARPAGNNEKYPALLRAETVSGLSPEDARARPHFDELTPVQPGARFALPAGDGPAADITRAVELLAPVARGQRGLVASPPRCGGTTVLVSLAAALAAGTPEAHVVVVLVDGRPEEITEVRRTLDVEVVASAFDRPVDEHLQVTELAIERAKRLVEQGRDVVVLLDGITSLARAYNLANPGSGRVVSGGIDPVAVQAAKRSFGAGRNTEEAGSLTILATVVVESGSGTDEVVLEELEGTATMLVRLDRHLAERRLYPAIDVGGTSSRNEEQLYDPAELPQVWELRRTMSTLASEGGSSAALEHLLDRLHATRTLPELLAGSATSPAPSA